MKIRIYLNTKYPLSYLNSKNPCYNRGEFVLVNGRLLKQSKLSIKNNENADSIRFWLPC